ncbi:LTA synthase family protein [Hymenobacter sp. BT175]|uniref:LTA synthase family protein n=1 Tax=Hymenobacter translucens TaxID=2886507 RepID=UPI001D0F2A12|nr:LTA synthase family protein [Hymenobacter translucens]MCC2545325.1 LTA synthase family protein [Hymenobacter translucens]
MPSLTLRLLFRRLLLLMGAYLLLRLGFFLANRGVFQEATPDQVLLAFWHGFRFDMSAIVLLNLPFILLSLIPNYRLGWQGALRGVYLVLNSVGLALNIVDAEYFKFIGRRTTNELTTVGGDIQRQAGQLFAHYWYLTIPFAVLMGLLWYFFPLPPANAGRSGSRRRRITVLVAEILVLAGLAVLAIRGGLQLKPLRTGHAFLQQPSVLGHLTLNSTFTFLRTLDYDDIEPKHYFASSAEARQALGARPLPAPNGPARRDNVVILMLESFGSEYTGIDNNGQGYTPFFDSLATKGLFFRDHYANGRRSIEALPAVLAGLPSLMEGPFITSNFQTDELHGLGHLLGKNGYSSAVYHGATNGTMGFNTFAGIAGIQRYYGLDEYPGAANSPDYDGHWGIFDEPYLQYFARQLNGQSQPFFATLFTLSSHDPFTIPQKYEGRFPKGELPIHPTIAYTDHALRQFFKTASRQPWYRNTLFVLVADHTSQSIKPDYQNVLGNYKTPLLLFHPGQTLPAADPRRITQQADIPATVLDYLNLPAGPLLPFGASAFDTTAAGRALFLSGDTYYLVHRDFVTELTADNQVRLYPYQTHFIPSAPLANPDPAKVRQYGNELRGAVQLFTNGLINNTLYK